MAKLNGVTVLPAVIERITYKGVEYAEVDGPAQAGDIVRFERYIDDVNKGDFFEMKIRSSGSLHIIDNEGVARNRFSKNKISSEITVFRRIETKSAPITDAIPTKLPVLPNSLPSEYVIHDGKVYRKDARKAEVGDKIIVVAPVMTFEYYKLGDVLTVERNVGQHHVDIGKAVLEHSEYNVLTLVDSVTINGTEYTLEKRKATKGEKLLITAKVEQCMDEMTIGKIYEVVTAGTFGTHDNVIDDRRREASAERAGFYVITPKSSATTEQTTDINVESTQSIDAQITELERQLAERKARKAAAERLKVGNYGKLTENSARFCKGDIVYVFETDKTEIPYRARSLDGITVSWISDYRLVRATIEEVAEAKRQLAEKERFKVGDYAKTLVSKEDVSNGVIVKITEVDNDNVPYRCEMLDGSEWDWFRQNELERVSAEDVAKAEEERKWAAIGRNVGEIKEGDIVRCTRSTGGHPVGTIGVVVKDETLRNLRVLANGEVWSHHGQLELVTPVESVVKLDASMADTDRY